MVTVNCHTACNEAYSSDTGAAYACSVGCGISLDVAIDNDMIQISMINNVMNMLFVTQVMDMLSYDDNVPTDINGEWSNEVDVFVSEVCVCVPVCVTVCVTVCVVDVTTVYCVDSLTPLLLLSSQDWTNANSSAGGSTADGQLHNNTHHMTLPTPLVNVQLVTIHCSGLFRQACVNI